MIFENPLCSAAMRFQWSQNRRDDWNNIKNNENIIYNSLEDNGMSMRAMKSRDKRTNCKRFFFVVFFLKTPPCEMNKFMSRCVALRSEVSSISSWTWNCRNQSTSQFLICADASWNSCEPSVSRAHATIATKQQQQKRQSSSPLSFCPFIESIARCTIDRCARWVVRSSSIPFPLAIFIFNWTKTNELNLFAVFILSLVVIAIWINQKSIWQTMHWWKTKNRHLNQERIRTKRRMSNWRLGREKFFRSFSILCEKKIN